ncbi:MAG: hypothetical protein ACM30F_00380, partial [Nitrospirota bacterium]
RISLFNISARSACKNKWMPLLNHTDSQNSSVFLDAAAVRKNSRVLATRLLISLLYAILKIRISF